MDLGNALMRVASIIVGAILRVVEFVIGSATGTNQDLLVRFERVTAAHSDTATVPATTRLEYRPVPRGAMAGLHVFWGHSTPWGDSIIGPRLAHVPIGDDGTAIFPQIWTGAGRRLYVSLDNLPIDPSRWDSKYLNFYHEEVRGVVPAGQRQVFGVFSAQELIDSQVTFQIRGFPVHARITYSYGFDQRPGFGGDPGDPRTVRHVPIPLGIRVSLCRELPAGLAQTLMRGRTTTGPTGIRETVWNAVLYTPLDPLPPSELIDPLKPAASLSLHVTMDMVQDGLGPIIAHGLPYLVDVTPDGILGLPAIEVRSDPPEQVHFDHQALDLSLGTMEDPTHLDINPNTTQVGPLVAPAPADVLGHRAIFALQAISDAYRCFWSLGKNAGKDAPDYQGSAVDIYLVDTLGILTSTSWPPQLVAAHPLWLARQHWNEHSVIAHEFGHQISYERGLLSTGLPDPYWLTELPFHESGKVTSPEIALLEGWAEFVEAEFGRLDGVGPIDNVWFGADPSSLTSLWVLEPGGGESVEGCVARALFQAYKAVHDLTPIPQLEVAITTTPVGATGDDITGVHAFVDANGNGVADGGEPDLSDHFLEYLGANEFRLTDQHGEASLQAPSGQVTGVSVGPARIIPAALTHTSQLDHEQAALWRLDPGLAPASAGIFAALFFDCWYPEVPKAHELYLRMLRRAHDVSPEFYDRIRRTFWDNNMVTPVVAMTDPSPLGASTPTSVYRLGDALSEPIAGTFPARVIQSGDLADLFGAANDTVNSIVPDQFLSTNANGEIPAASLAIDTSTLVVVIDINIRSLLPRADAEDHDVWVRGRFLAPH